MKQKFEVEQHIQLWHEEFQRVKCDWVVWCERYAANYDSADQAWAAFIKEQQQKTFRFGLQNPAAA